MDMMGQPTNIWGMVNRLPSLFSQQEPTQPKPTREAAKKRLLDSIYNAEGSKEGSMYKDGKRYKIPFNYFSKDFVARRERGEQIPVAEAREAVSAQIDRHIKLWEANKPRNVDWAEERGLVNANPEKNKAIRDGKWNPDFIKWYGEIYAPAAEDPLNENWVGNVRAGLGLSKIDYGVTLPSEYHTPMEKLERAWELTKDTLSDPLDMYPVRQPLTQPQMAVPDKSMMYPEPKPQMPINKSMMYPEPKRSLQQQAQTAQVQPALNPFPWLKEVSGSYSYPSPPDRRWI